MPDGRWVVVLEVVLGDQGTRRGRDGRGRQRQDLELGAVERDEVQVDEAIAHDEVVVERELKGGADPVVGVVLRGEPVDELQGHLIDGHHAERGSDVTRNDGVDQNGQDVWSGCCSTLSRCETYAR